MRNTFPLLSRPLGETTNTINKSSSILQQKQQQQQPASQSAIPSIRLITGTPSATGLSCEANSLLNNMSFEGSSWGSIPASILAPKPEQPSAPKRRLVPKKSKLGLLNVVGNKDKENKRPGASGAANYNRQQQQESDMANRSFEIYVDPTMDPELGEILLVKKKKSRAALDGMRWGPLEEVTNVPPASSNSGNNGAKGAPALPQSSGFLKLRGEEKWWSIGRGRKDSKNKSGKEGKENNQQESLNMRAESPEPMTFIPPSTKTPGPLVLGGDNRARFNSLDSGIVLKPPTTTTLTPSSVHMSKAQPEVAFSRSRAPTAGDLLAPPALSSINANASQNQGSIAIRAMRSVRSLARIGSWAQLRRESIDHDGLEKGVKGTEIRKETEGVLEKKSKKSKEKKEKGEEGKKGKKEKKEKKDKDKDEDKEKKKVHPGSMSGFEVDGPPPEGTLDGWTMNPPQQDHRQTLGRKVSVLGLGLPSSMRLPTLRSASMNSNSSVVAGTGAQTNAHRLSVESAFLRGRRGSVLSNGSSLRPASTASSASRVSSQSNSSVRWDEEGLETVKELRRKERQEKAKEEKKSEKKDKKKRSERSEKDDAERERGSRRSSEGRKRTLIADVFPDISSRRSSLASNDPAVGSKRSSVVVQGSPLLTVKEATCGSLDADGLLDEIATPMKRARPRPLSEQLVGKARPTGLYENDDGVLSVLDAATNDLAQLIMTLNLEATPGNTPNVTPLRQSSDNRVDKSGLNESIMGRHGLLPESPLRRSLRQNITSIASLRSYAKSLRRTGSQLLGSNPKNTTRRATNPASGSEGLIGQQIAPWSKLLEGLCPTNKQQAAETLTKGTTVEGGAHQKPYSMSSTGTFRKGHQRQTTPAPEPEPAPAFYPLRPAARPKNAVSSDSATSNSVESSESSIELGRGAAVIRGVPSSSTLRLSTMTSKKLLRKWPSTNLTENKEKNNNRVPIPPETKRVLGMSGTLGGSSDIPAIYAVPEMDTSDPDSDIPDELQFILSANLDGASFRSVPLDDDDDTFSFPKKMNKNEPVSRPPSIPLPVPVNVSMATIEESSLLPPVFRARVIRDETDIDIDIDMDERENASEYDTVKSFDFTGELKKLDESGESDRRSFVEQLENAFRTPSKVELSFDLLGGSRVSRLLTVDERPLHHLPFVLTEESEENEKMNTFEVNAAYSQSRPHSQLSGSGSDSRTELLTVSKLMDEKELSNWSSRSKSALNLHVSRSQILNAKEPTLPFGTDSLRSGTEGKDKEEMEPDVSFSSTRSNGQLNMSFKFGGKPKPPSPASSEKKQKPLTLSDIIPPPSHARSLSESLSFMEEEDSVLKSIYTKSKNGGQPRPRVTSDSSTKRRNRFSARSFLAHSRHSSALSFAGFDLFEEIRRGFEFGGQRPVFYPPAAGSGGRNGQQQQQQQRDSVLSIASVSSYGRVINPGVIDPFGFSLPCLRERPSSEEISPVTFSFSVDDTFSFIRRPSRRIRVDSDASSFYFRPPLPNRSQNRSHKRQESSVSSVGGPPISFYNRNHAAHRKSDSSTGSSMALSYAMSRTSGGRASWARHRYDPSIDSMMNDLSALKVTRPDLGDKMFDATLGQHNRMSLTSIKGSPSETDRSSSLTYAKSTSFDSIIDISDEPKTSDFIFDKTGQRTTDLTESVFIGNDSAKVNARFESQFRPISVISTTSIPSAKEDDTWITMIGGGHVRRQSVASAIQASPCERVEKRKRSFGPMDSYEEEKVSPVKILKEPSIVFMTPSKFGDERMIKASKGLLQRQSLEESCLIAEGEDASMSFGSVPVFSRPLPAGRSRSSTCTSSSGTETPPLSSDGSSVSGGSQSSIDIAHLNSLLASATFPMSDAGTTRTRTRARARGQGHRRRYSAARASRTSIYETIEEEGTNTISPTRTVTPSKFASPTTTVQPVVVVDSETASLDLTVSDACFWDGERGIVALNKYYALRHEAEDTVVESKRVWVDTPFSIFAVQNFQPPRNPERMKALLQHSVQSYGPLPSELRPRRRSRTFSRPSPYPLARVSRVFHPPEPKESPPVRVNPSPDSTSPQAASILQEVHVKSNVPPSPAPSFTSKAFSPEKEPIKRGRLFGQPSMRPCVGSSARRAPLGWMKRNVKPSNGDQKGNKENKESKENVSMGSLKGPGESLRLNRPRPRGRPTPATQLRPIRV